MSRFLAIVGMGLLAAVGVTGVLAGPGGVLGGGSSDDSPAAAQSGDTLDGETEVVGDVIVCPTGEETQFKFEREGDKFEVKGLLVSLNGTVVVEVTGAGDVPGPDGLPTGGNVVTADAAGAEIEGAPVAGDVVEVEGVVENGAFVAHKIERECGDHDDDCDDGDDGDDSDDSDDDDGEVETECEDVDDADVDEGDVDDDTDVDDDSDSDSDDVEDDDADDHDAEDDDEDHSGPGGDDDDEHDEEDDNQGS